MRAVLELLFKPAAFGFAIRLAHLDPAFALAFVLAGAIVFGSAARALPFAGVDAPTFTRTFGMVLVASHLLVHSARFALA